MMYRMLALLITSLVLFGCPKAPGSIVGPQPVWVPPMDAGR